MPLSVVGTVFAVAEVNQTDGIQVRPGLSIQVKRYSFSFHEWVDFMTYLQLWHLQKTQVKRG